MFNILVYMQKARQRNKQYLNKLRQSPFLYQQYLDKKRDEKRLRRANKKSTPNNIKNCVQPCNVRQHIVFILEYQG